MYAYTLRMVYAIIAHSLRIHYAYLSLLFIPNRIHLLYKSIRLPALSVLQSYN